MVEQDNVHGGAPGSAGRKYSGAGPGWLCPWFGDSYVWDFLSRSNAIRIAAVVLLAGAVAGCGPSAPRYRDPSLPVEARVKDLLGRMTLEEKFWQVMTWPDDAARPADSVPAVFGLQVRAGTPAETARRMAALQRHAMTGTRLGIPLLFYEEALHGVVQPGATAFPQAIGLAATWDTALMARVAGAAARQARERGIRQVLSPVINVASDARWGRVEETYGEDPFLTTRLAVAFVGAFERAGVVTTPKHFVANVGDGGRDSWPAEWSRGWLGEAYLPPFEAAVREAGARSVMAAYNSVEGRPASANPWLLDSLLRQRWGFGGVVISDAGGVGGAVVLHRTAADYPASAAAAIPAGTDVIFQGGGDRIKELFWPAFLRGLVPVAALDRAVGRVLRLKFSLGLFDQPPPTDAEVPPATAADRDLAFEAAARSLVLLRNNGVLPLGRDGGPVALIGLDAVEARLGGYSGPGVAPVSIRAALEARLGRERVRYAPGPGRSDDRFAVVPSGSFEGGVRLEMFHGPDLAGPPVAAPTVPNVDATWTLGPPDSRLGRGWYSVRWRGRLRVSAGRAVTLAVEGPDGYRLVVDGRRVLDRWGKRSAGRTVAPGSLAPGLHDVALEYHENVGPARIRLLWDAGAGPDPAVLIEDAARVARGARAAVVVAGLEEGEFRDRSSLGLPGRQEALIDAVRRTGVPTIVVIVGGSAVVTRPWLEGVAAVLDAWYPGERGGDAVAAALLGEVNPGGRLPITFPQSEGQLPLSYFHRPTGRGDDYLDRSGAPEFPFGFGLSYTSFAYADLVVGPGDPAAGDTVSVRFTVRNTGRVAGDEVAQVYLRPDVSTVAGPVLALAGFSRVGLAPGEARVVTVRLAPVRFARVGDRLDRVIEPGRFDVLVGGSSVEPRLQGTIAAGARR